MTSLRRSVLNISFNSPTNENDDEKERRDSRRRTILSENSLAIDENETLKSCLKNYQEQKLSKDNAWTVPLIDTLSLLMQKHNKLVKNFQVVGSTLEASSKIYGFRVDSVHLDIIRMSSGLTKQTFVDLGAAKDDINADDAQGEEEEQKNKPAKKKKKQISTIARNKGFLNGKLEIHPSVDSFFSKLNAVENISGPNRALLNLLSSNHSELKIKSSNEFWNSSEVNLIENDLDSEIFEDVFSIPLETELTTDFLVRPKNSGYIISDTPEDDDKSEDEPHHDTLNTSQLSVAFDINAEIDNIPENNFIMDVEMDDFDCLTVEDQMAINACKELRRAPVSLQDMRPIDSNNILEYSYRPTDIIDKFWAGPSHWKFKRNFSKTLQDPSEIYSKRKKSKKFEPFTIPDSLEIDFDLFFGGSKKKNRSVYRNWDQKKNMLPTNLLLDEQMFDKYHFAPGLIIDLKIHCNSPDNTLRNDIIENVGNDSNEFNSNEDIGGEIFDRSMQNASEIAFTFEGAPDMLEKINLPLARAKIIDMKLLKSVSLRILNLKSQVIPAKTLNESNLKNLEKATGNLKIKENYVGSVVSYNDVCTDVSLNVPKTQADNMSRAVAFYTLLHLANENNLRLVQSDKLEDFLVLKIQY